MSDLSSVPAVQTLHFPSALSHIIPSLSLCPAMNSIQSSAEINDDLTCLVVAFPIKAISLKEKCIISMLLVALGGCWVVAYWFKSKASTFKSLWYSGLNIWLGFLIQIYMFYVTAVVLGMWSKARLLQVGQFSLQCIRTYKLEKKTVPLTACNHLCWSEQKH